MLLAVFAADAAVNVTACAVSRRKLRSVSKVLLMPLLLGVYLLFSKSPSWIVALGLLLGWIGDIFLIYKDNIRLLAVGMASFGLGHIFYIAGYFVLAGVHPPLWAAVILPLLIVGAGCVVAAFMRGGIPKELRFPVFGYTVLLCGAASVAGLTAFGGSPGGWIMFAGTLLFLASDGILSIETFVKEDAPAYDFAVMLTYISAQALIAAGFCLV